MQLDHKIRDMKVGPNPYTWFTADTLIDTWESLERAVRERDSCLISEQERQERDNELRVIFAKAADDFSQALVQFRLAINKLDGSIEDQLAKLTNAQTELNGSFKDALENIENVSRQLEERFIVENRFTVHSPLSLAQSWDQSRQVVNTMIRDLKQQLTAMSECGVSNQSLKEYTMMFRHFDKDRTGHLNHSEFKNCLRALGYDFPSVDEEPGDAASGDAQFERYIDQVDYIRSGSINLSSFITFMINQETELIQSVNDLVVAFKALTQHGHRPYITKEELNENLPVEVADFCTRKMPPYKDSHDRFIDDAYDYEAFVFSCFENFQHRSHVQSTAHFNKNDQDQPNSGVANGDEQQA
ncbi:hypothetical protein ACOME3_007348 [Neoechinorhynchus agilis]